MTPLVDRNHGSRVLRRLAKAYPDAECALVHENPLQLLLATILSAQCTDVRVNMVTPALFEMYPTARDFAESDPEELEGLIRSTGFFRSKARAIREACRDIVELHGGRVPSRMEDLVGLRGVGRKTANVVLGNAFDTPGITVDTHVRRISRRLGLTDQQDPVRIEQDLMRILPRKAWTSFSHAVILHGRAICSSRKPRCPECPLRDVCPSADLPAAPPKSVRRRKRG